MREAIVQRLRKALQKPRISVDTATTQDRFSQALLEYVEDYRNALARGVTARIVIEKPLVAKKAEEVVQMLGKNPALKSGLNLIHP